jgi:hypothetical protein
MKIKSKSIAAKNKTDIIFCYNLIKNNIVNVLNEPIDNNCAYNYYRNLKMSVGVWKFKNK